MYCNCGCKMYLAELLPTRYFCKKCTSSLIIDKNGVQKFYDADGNQVTYQPLKPKEK